MNLKNIDEQREFLQRNLTRINKAVSDYLEVEVNLQIQEKKTYRNETYFKLIDDNNFCNDCGIMSRAWKKVIIDTFNIWWTAEGAILDMHFRYEHIDGGHNGAHFCKVNVYDDYVGIE